MAAKHIFRNDCRVKWTGEIEFRGENGKKVLRNSSGVAPLLRNHVILGKILNLHTHLDGSVVPVRILHAFFVSNTRPVPENEWR